MAHSILVVEHESELREWVSITLKAASFTVFEAENGVPALRLYREHRPDLVITGMVMPEKDGIETIREICQIDPGARIIAMSSDTYGRMDFLGIARSFGASETLRVPFRADELLDCVERAIAHGGRRAAGTSF